MTVRSIEHLFRHQPLVIDSPDVATPTTHCPVRTSHRHNCIHIHSTPVQHPPPPRPLSSLCSRPIWLRPVAPSIPRTIATLTSTLWLTTSITGPVLVGLLLLFLPRDAMHKPGYRNRNRNHTESMLPPTQDRRPSTMSKMIVVIGNRKQKCL